MTNPVPSRPATYIVSGGASRLGAAFVRRISEGGNNVIIGDLDEAAGSEIADELKHDIALRSGIDEAEIQALFSLIDKISGQDDLTQKELKLLTERIDQFYNHSQR